MIMKTERLKTSHPKGKGYWNCVPILRNIHRYTIEGDTHVIVYDLSRCLHLPTPTEVAELVPLVPSSNELDTVDKLDGFLSRANKKKNDKSLD